MKGTGEFITIVGVMAGILGLGLLVFVAGETKGYTDGYCSALNGTTLNMSSCNVDGKVVEVAK